MLKTMSDVLKTVLKNAAGMIWLPLKGKLRPPIKVKLTRKNLFVWLPNSQGGDLHVLPRSVVSGHTTFSVQGSASTGDSQSFNLQMTPFGAAAVPLATYTSEAEARVALSLLNKALTGTKIVKWLMLAILLWFAWLFGTSYMQIAGGSGSISPSAELPANFTPPANPAMQGVPSAAGAEGGGTGDLANYIYQQAMAAKEKSQYENMPPQAGAATAGLDGFGLGTGGSQSQNGPGCDPGLAFNVAK